MGTEVVSENVFVDCLNQVKDAFDSILLHEDIEFPSYFDVTTAIALLIATRIKADYCILEAGMGGTYDSTSIIPTKKLALLCPTGLDHTHILGDNISSIARAHAGITTNAERCFTTQNSNEALKVILKSASCSVSVVKDPVNIDIDWEGTEFTLGSERYTTPLLGSHQAYNQALAIHGAQYLGVNTDTIKDSIKSITLPARFEVFHGNPIIFLDSAHNKDKILATVSTLKKLNVEKINLVVGFSHNKPHTFLKDALSGVTVNHVAATRFSSNQYRTCRDPREIAQLFTSSSQSLHIDSYDALTYVQGKYTHPVLVTGSCFLAGELRSKLMDS